MLGISHFDKTPKRLIIIVVMNITKSNFAQTLPFILNTLRNSHFISLDLEMSGIITEELTSPSIMDSMQLRYQKQRQSINRYIPLQLGLSSFRVAPQENKIWISPFNFYVFPLSLKDDLMKFNFHVGTMNFLTSNHFDFNKLFYEGVPFVNKNRMDQMKEKEGLKQIRQQIRKAHNIKSPQSQAFLKMNIKPFQQWINSQETVMSIDINHVKYQSYILFRQHIESLYPSRHLQFEFDKDQIYRRKIMIVRKLDGVENIIKKEQIQQEASPCEQSLLLNRVIDEIIQLKKPMIVHNGYLDLMHIYHRFIDDLPSTLNQYKHQLQKNFPTIYDNKYLYATSPYLLSQLSSNITSLQNCFQSARAFENKKDSAVQNNKVDNIDINDKNVKLQIDPLFEQYSFDTLECHEAGFDSLMTGYSFLSGILHLKPNIDLTDTAQLNRDISQFRNRIPQGSIRVPLNLEADHKDIYIEDGHSGFYFRPVKATTMSEQSIQNYFSGNFGAVSLRWTNFQFTQFCVVFLDQKDRLSFENTLKQLRGDTSAVVHEIEGEKYLVLNQSDYQLLVCNTISNYKEKEPTL